MSERTIHIRPDPLRVVVKPHPGVGNWVNQFGFEDQREATAYANRLHEQRGWPVVDETA